MVAMAMGVTGLNLRDKENTWDFDETVIQPFSTATKSAVTTGNQPL